MTELADDPALADWALVQPTELTADPLWRLDAYRHAAFMLTLARTDAELIGRDPIRVGVAAQLLTSAASVPANIAEGYGRPTAPDRIRFFAYAIGSAREAISWYEASRGAMDEELRKGRLARLSRIRRILLGLINRARSKAGKRFDAW